MGIMYAIYADPSKMSEKMDDPIAILATEDDAARYCRLSTRAIHPRTHVKPVQVGLEHEHRDLRDVRMEGVMPGPWWMRGAWRVRREDLERVARLYYGAVRGAA